MKHACASVEFVFVLFFKPYHYQRAHWIDQFY